MEKEGKKYIEFLLHNEDHLREIQQLDNLFWEIVDCLDNGEYTRENLLRELPKDALSLLDRHYYYDPEIDVMGIIGHHWTGGIEEANLYSPGEVVSALRFELERRPKRKRKFPVMWEKLESMGLAKRK